MKLLSLFLLMPLMSFSAPVENDFQIGEIVAIRKFARLPHNIRARAVVVSRKGNRYRCIYCVGGKRRGDDITFTVRELRRWKAAVR